MKIKKRIDWGTVRKVARCLIVGHYLSPLLAGNHSITWRCNKCHTTITVDHYGNRKWENSHLSTYEMVEV